MKKGILHVQLMDRLGMEGGDADNCLDGLQFDHRAESLIVVNVVTLGKAADHPAWLVTGKRTVGVKLVHEDPLARHNIGARSRGMRCQVWLSTRTWNSLVVAAH